MNLDRISRNEERLDKISNNIRNLEASIEEFKANTKDLSLLNKYYSSKNWIKDKEDYESGKFEKTKAGVLSEDAVWNMNEDIDYLIQEMEEIVKNYRK